MIKPNNLLQWAHGFMFLKTQYRNMSEIQPEKWGAPIIRQTFCLSYNKKNISIIEVTMIYFFLDVYIFSDIQLYPCGREQLLLFIDNCSVKLLELTECLLVLIAEAIIFLKELLQSVNLYWLNEWQELEQNNFVKWHSSSLKKTHTSAYSSEMSSGEMQSMSPSKNANFSEKSISLKAIKATKYFNWLLKLLFVFLCSM